MVDGDTGSATGPELLEAGEAALERGASTEAFEMLQRAATIGVPPAILPRLANAYASAGRLCSRHDEVLAWVESAVDGAEDPALRATLLRCRVAVCRQLDVQRVLEIADDALAAAEAVADEEAIANILSHGAFAGYRKGDAHAANGFADRAAERAFASADARYDALRAQMFAATARGDTEASLNVATKCRALARELGRTVDVANESNNLAEFYLDLGCANEARACAMQAADLAEKVGHSSLVAFATVLRAVATAELGQIDAALEMFDAIDDVSNRVFGIDRAAAHAYWLLERNAAGDAERARDIATRAIRVAARAGVSNRLTMLYGNVARSYAREGNMRSAQSAIEQARQAAEHAEPAAELLLALAVAEVLPSSDPKRKVVLNSARVRILRTAERREDPRAFCCDVRLNRRILELSGGVPDDLPPSE